MKTLNGSGLKTILDQMLDVIVVVDPEGEILFYNNVASRNGELAAKPLHRGMSVLETISPERVEAVRNLLDSVRTSKIAQRTIAEYKHPLGYSFFFDVIYNPILNDQDQVEQICIVGHDITAQRSVEKKNLELFQDLSSLIENANAVIFGVDSRGYITEWNRECIRLGGYEKNDVLTNRVEMLVDTEDSDRLGSVLDRTTRGERITNFELKLITKSGNVLVVLFNVTPKANSSGKVIGALFVGQDITELSQYKSALEKKVEDRTRALTEALEKERELVEIRNKFVFMASHEFKVPLASISSSVNTLLKGKKISQGLKQKLVGINDQVSNLKSLLDDMLAVGKNSVTKIKPNLQRIEFIPFLQHIITEVTVSRDNSHVVTTNFSVPSIILLSDEKLLRNIFVNLLSNAIKFSPLKKEVQVTVTLEASYIHVEVTDFGIGIRPEELETIFEPFNRGTNVTNIEGTGLGLSIVKKAVSLLGGELNVKSKFSEMTKFTVRLNRLS